MLLLIMVMMTTLKVAEVREELKDAKAAERLRSSAEKQVRPMSMNLKFSWRLFGPLDLIDDEYLVL